MKLVFDDQAIADLENIFGWIAQDSPAIARSVTDRLFSSMELLISFPFIGHVGRDPDTSNGWFRGCLILWCTKLIECKSELS
jgi:toxin ParE1/3/4